MSEFDEELYWTLIDIANGLLTGTVIGGYYAMIAIGLALTFGVMRLVNWPTGTSSSSAPTSPRSSCRSSRSPRSTR